MKCDNPEPYRTFIWQQGHGAVRFAESLVGALTMVCEHAAAEAQWAASSGPSVSQWHRT
jgi:hypothetical protein